MIRRVEVLPDLESLSRAAAALVADRLRAAADDGRAAIALSGGTTPRRLYELLAADRTVPWGAVDVYWVDERFVPRSSPESNYGLATATLLRAHGLRPDRIHAIDVAAASVTGATDAYDAEFDAHFRDPVGVPTVAIVGVGDDGHTASIFPTDRGQAAAHGWAASIARAPHPPHVARVSLTLRALARFGTVVGLAAGDAKRAVVARVLAPATDDDRSLPAAELSARDEVVWFLDAAAAGSGP